MDKYEGLEMDVYHFEQKNVIETSNDDMGEELGDESGGKNSKISRVPLLDPFGEKQAR